MANGGRIDYTIGFKLDKAGLNEISKSLSAIQSLTPENMLSFKNGGSLSNAKKELKELKNAAVSVETALQKSFNTRLNTVNIQTFTQEINKSYGSVEKLYAALNKGGYAGQKTASTLTKQFLTANSTIHKTTTLLDKMGTTLMNTLKWTFSSSLINRFIGNIQQAVGYVEHLDSSLNDIRIVTKKSADEMNTFAENANKAAKALGKATTDYTEAALIYYQQGLSDEEVKARAETTLKAANVTGQATKTVSEQLTSVWNGFRVGAEQTEEYVDKLAAVAAISASNLEELSTGMSKVASAASNLGVDIDQLTAQISTIVSVTRQAPESVGTALKTIYARISDLKLGESDEDGLGLGDVSGGLQKLGIEVLDSEGELRDLGTVIEEVAAKWNTWTSAQQAAIAQLMAGKRQYNNLVALFSNWDMYTNAIETSRNATGELQKQQDIYMESTEAHLQQMKTQFEDLYDSILDPNTIIKFADTISKLAKGATTFVDAIGGGNSVLSHLIGLLGTLLNGKIAAGINELWGRAEQNKAYAEQLSQRINYAKQIGQITEGSAKAMTDHYNKWSKYAGSMTEDQIRQAEMRTQEIGDQAEIVELQKQKNKEIREEVHAKREALQNAEDELNNQQQQLKSNREKAAQEVARIERLMNRRGFQYEGGNQNRLSDITGRKASGIIENQWNNSNNNTVTRQIKQDFEQLKGIIDSAQSSLKKFKTNYTKFEAGSSEAGVFTRMNNEVTQLEHHMTQLYTAGQINTDTFNQFNTALAEARNNNTVEAWGRVKTILDSLGQQAKVSKENIEQLMATLSESPENSNAIQVTKENIKQLKQELDQLNEKRRQGLELRQEEQKRFKQLTKAYDEHIQKRQATIQGIMQVANGLHQTINLLSTVKKSMEDIAKGDASFGSIISQLASMTATGIMSVTMLAKGLENLGGVLGKLGTFLSGPWGIAIMAGVTAIVATISIFSATIQAEYEEIAESTKNAADAAKKETDALIDQKKAVDELVTSYKALDKTSITYRNDLRKLLIGHGEFTLAAQTATASVEELDEAIKRLQKDANEQVISSTANQLDKLKNAIAADINANVLSTTERDDERNRQTIDLGGEADTNSIKKILDDFGIEVVTEYGHIDLQQFVNAMVTNEDQLRQALQASGTSAARRLLEIMGSEQEMLTSVAEALTEQQEAKLSNIQADFNFKGKTYKEYDAAFNDLYEKAKAVYGEGNEKLAEEWAKKRIAETGELGTAYAGLEDETKKVIATINKELTAAELNYFNDHIKTWGVYGYDSAEEFLEKAQEAINAKSRSGLLVPVTLAINTDELKDEDITSLFSNGPIGDLTEGEFRLFDAQKQKRELKKFLSDAAALQSHYNNQTVKEELKMLDDSLTNQQDYYDKLLGLAKSYNIDEHHLWIYEDEQKRQIHKKRLAEFKAQYEANEKELELNKQVLESSTGKHARAQKNIDAIKEEQAELEVLIKSYENRVNFGEAIDKINQGNDKSAQASIDTYEATVNEIYQRQAEIIAQSKDLAAAIQDIQDLELWYQAGQITDTDFAERYKQLDRARDIEGLDTETLEDYTKYLQETAKASVELANSLEEDGDAADIVAKSIMKMNKAVEELSDGFEEWSDILQNSEESSEEYSQALNKIRASIADLLDISEDYVSKDYLLANLEDIGLAAEGDAEAIDRLRQALSQDVIMHFGLEDNIADDLLNKVNYWQNILDSKELVAGATLDDEGMMQALSAMVAQAGLTVDQVNALFDSMGFEANFATEPQMVDQIVPEYVTETADIGTRDVMYGDQPVTFIRTRTHTYQDGFYKAKGYMDAMAMTTNGKTPKINKITKKASGAMNNYSSKNPGGKKSSGGSGSKGGGGKEPSKEKPLERDTDIYRVVNQELSQVESQLNNIDKINSHQWGANYKKTLEQQNVLLKQQTALLEKKNKLQIDDLATRRKQLEDEGLKFSEDGAIILNAEEYLNELYAEHNKLIDAHNNMTAAEQEVDKANLETSENRIKAVEKRIEEYEALRKEADDVYSQRLEQHYAEIENEVKIFNAEVDLHLELKDAEKEWNDFWKEVVEDVKDNDFAGQIAADMKQLDTLIGVNSGFEGSTGEALLTHIQKELAEVDKTIASAGEDGLFGDNIKLAYENLVKYRDQLMATLREAKEKLDHMAENYVKQLEYSWELIDKQVERFEAIGKHINHNLELIKLVDGEKAYDALDMQYENQYENNLQLLDTLNKSKDIAEQEMNKHKALMEQYAEGTPERETAAKAYESSVNEYLKITEQLDSTLENTLQSIKEQTENTNAKILDTLDKAMSGGIGLDLVEEEWKLINDEADKYYDNVERYINMEEYTHQLNEAADAIGLSAANQQKLNQFREEELKQLNEKERLTSYDIEESRARLEILKQELALQDAQANKSKMRLRRDSQGNYNYQYVADENAIEEAENGLLTAKKEWYSLVKKRYQELSNDIISIQKQQLEYAKQIKDAESAGDIERLNKYKELYNQNAEYLRWAMTEAEKNKRDMYNGTQLYFKQVDDTTLEQSKTTVRQLVDQWAGGGEKSFTGAVKKAIEDLDAAQETFKSKTAAALSAAGVNYNNLTNNNIDPVLAKLNSLTDKNLFDKLSNINKELENQWKNLEKGAKAYEAFKTKAVGELGLVEKEIKTLSQLITNIPSPKLATPSAGNAPNITYDKGSSSSSNSSSSGGDTGGGNTYSGTQSTNTNRYKVAVLNRVDNYTGAKIKTYQLYIGTSKTPKLVRDGNDGQKQIEDWLKKNGYHSNEGQWLAGTNTPSKFRSGGYTGSWGDDSGRWALLHQKELVLNENDTKNMLSAVQILRSIPYSVIAQSLINSSTNTASALSGINSGISGLAAAATNNESKTMVVNADFSGVHDADEIYQALLELENYGLQNSYSVAPHANSMY